MSSPEPSEAPPHDLGEAAPLPAISWLLRYLRAYRGPLTVSLSLLLLAVPLVNFHPLVWGIVADRLVEGSLTPGALFFWIGVMSATYLVGLALNAIHTYLLEKSGQGFVRDIRCALFNRFESQSLTYHHSQHTGDLVTRIVSDVDAMEQSVLQGVAKLFEEITTFVVVAGIVLWISPLVGAISILPLALSFIFIRAYNHRVKSIYEQVRRHLGQIGKFVQDRLAGIQITQSFGREKEEMTAFRQRADAFYTHSVRASRMRAVYFPTVSLFGFVNNVAMLGLGAWLIMNQSAGFTLGALLAYRGFWWRLQSPIRTIAQTSDILQRARASAQRVGQLLHAPQEVSDHPEALPLAEPFSGRLKFERVSFAYDPGHPVLSEISFSVAPGEFVAIAGGSGSGKTTLLNLIPRFYEVSSGHVWLDEQDTARLTLSSLRDAMGLVSQESYLFDGSVRENLLYGRPTASVAEMETAATEANAHDFIGRLPQGYETHVGQNGVKLSGGQRQRLALARAFLRRPRILLLDEPTASVEPESEALIHQAILRRARKGNEGTLLVTHRIDLLRHAPRILFLHEGRLQGDGDHQTLIVRCPAYAEAYQQWEREESHASS